MWYYIIEVGTWGLDNVKGVFEMTRARRGIKVVQFWLYDSEGSKHGYMPTQAEAEWWVKAHGGHYEKIVFTI